MAAAVQTTGKYPGQYPVPPLGNNVEIRTSLNRAWSALDGSLNGKNSQGVVLQLVDSPGGKNAGGSIDQLMHLLPLVTALVRFIASLWPSNSAGGTNAAVPCAFVDGPRTHNGFTKVTCSDWTVAGYGVEAIAGNTRLQHFAVAVDPMANIALAG